VKQNKDKIQQQILDFWNSIKDRIPFENYNIDFVVLEDGVKIIEFNPFDEYTDSGLFSWVLHANLLRNGPFKFKIISEPWDIRGNTWWKHLVKNYKERSAIS